MPCATHSCLWCDFDAVSSGLPPPFPSFRQSLLVASAVSGLRTLFVWFCFFCFCYPRHYASACSHFNRRHSPTLRPVFTQLAHTALGAGVGFEPTMSYASLQPSLVAYTVAFDHSANPPDSFYIFSKFYLNNFMSSYNPSAMFFAI